MISYQEALEIVLADARPTAMEKVICTDAGGRVLAEDVVAEDNVPPFDNSAMDGFAVVQSDLETVPATLDVVGEVQAGMAPKVSIEAGKCVRIMTGAPVPVGTTAVVPVEWTTTENEKVTISQQPTVGQHIRRAGEDITVGDVVLTAGRVVSPPVTGLLAIAGLSSVAVRKKPRVAVIATGDEIIEPGSPLEAGQIRNSNGPTLAAQVKAAGGQPTGPFVARDTREDVERTLAEALEADILVFAGGVSVGEYDFVQEALEDRGMKTLFWRVRQRPGKPLLFGTLDGKPVFGLPGNPVSASVCFEIYVRPLLRKMLAGRDDCRTFEARLGAKLEKKKGLHYFARGIYTIEDAETTVKLAGPQASNIFSTMERANCLVHLPEEMEKLDAGHLVSVTPLNWSLT